MADKIAEEHGQQLKVARLHVSTLGVTLSSSLISLVHLGLAQAEHPKLREKLSRHVVNAAQAIVYKKREPAP